MANISEEKWIEILEKKADGTYIAKYPKVKSKSGITFDEHLADYATLDKAGHVKAETDADGRLILDIPKSNYNAIREPNKNDDETEGYGIGSRWIMNNAVEFVCLDNKEGEAIWVHTAVRKNEANYYDTGTEFVEFEGSFTGETPYRERDFRKEDSYMYLYVEGYVNGSSVRATTVEEVSLWGIDTLKIEWEAQFIKQSYTRARAEFGVIDGEGTTIASVVIENNFNKMITELDVSNINGSYKIRVIGYASDREKTTIKIYRIWGE